MIKHYLISMLRNAKQFKSVFFINLIGLSTGLACTIMILIWSNDELNVDKFHENDSRIYQIMSNLDFSGDIQTSMETPALLAESVSKEIPEIESTVAATPTAWFEPFTLSIDDNHIKAKGQFAGEDYFNIFSYNLLQGDKEKVLSSLHNMVVSESLSKKLFNTTENVLGKEVRFMQESSFIVSGVFKDVPENSSTKFDFILPYELFKQNFGMSLEWTVSGPSTFVLLKEGVKKDQVNGKIANFVKKKDSKASFQTLFIEQYSDGYLHGKYENGKQAGGRIEYVRMFSLIALFIILIACINFMNLSTAKATRRSKDVGIKKVLGATRKYLIFQYLGESVIMAFLSLIVAILIVLLLLPAFNDITGKDLSLSLSGGMILTILAITLFTGIISGSYPALYLSGFNPAAVLKVELSRLAGEIWARKGLAIFQFVVSVILIVFVLIVHEQMDFVQSKNLGYDKENTIFFDREGKTQSNLEGFLSAMNNIPGVEGASTIGGTLHGGHSSNSGLEWEGKNPNDLITFDMQPVNYGMLELLNIKVVEGNSFTKALGSSEQQFIFNESAIKAMGLKDPVGKTIRLWGKSWKVGGVVKDFHFKSLYEDIKPLFFTLNPNDTRIVMVKLKPGAERETISRIESFYQKFNPGFVLDYNFLDQEYQAQYVAESRVAKLSRYFAVIAIVISCLGLFGLASFTVDKKIKEIGIRKALGSSNFAIAYLFLKDFTKIVLLSIVIALPVSYFLIKEWLNDFAYSVGLSIWYFVGTGVLALVIAWLTVGIHAYRASQTNPLECLKYE